MGNPYNCIKGDILGCIGGSWFASYCTYDLKTHFPQKTKSYKNSMLWKRVSFNSRIRHFENSKFWVLMPNRNLKICPTEQKKKDCIKQGGVSIHAYWALWMITHCSDPILGNHMHISLPLFRKLLLQAIPYL